MQKSRTSASLLMMPRQVEPCFIDDSFCQHVDVCPGVYFLTTPFLLSIRACYQTAITYNVTGGASLLAVYHNAGGNTIGLSVFIVIFSAVSLVVSQVRTCCPMLVMCMIGWGTKNRYGCMCQPAANVGLESDDDDLIELAQLHPARQSTEQLIQVKLSSGTGSLRLVYALSLPVMYMHWGCACLFPYTVPDACVSSVWH